MGKLLLCFFSFALFFVKPAFSQDITGRWAIGYRYNYVNADDDDFRKVGAANGLNLTYGINKNLAVELETDYFGFKSKSYTRLRVTSFHTNLQLRKSFKNFVPYLVGGIGFQYYRYSELGAGDRKDKIISYSYKTGGGLEYFINKNLAANTEVAYVYGNTGGNATLDVYAWRFGAGLKYYF
jgi:opacity protein-like surface antigen